jgi:hypothetical protein
LYISVSVRASEDFRLKRAKAFKRLGLAVFMAKQVSETLDREELVRKIQEGVGMAKGQEFPPDVREARMRFIEKQPRSYLLRQFGLDED